MGFYLWSIKFIDISVALVFTVCQNWATGGPQAILKEALRLIFENNTTI